MLLVALFIASLVIVPHAEAKAQTRTLVVPDQYPTIQDAIDNASAGDKIFVKEGTYNLTALYIYKPLSLIGESNKNTILSGIRPTQGSETTIYISSDTANVLITGFTIKDGFTAIEVDGNHCKVTGNIIQNNNYGILVDGGNFIQIVNNKISNNYMGVIADSNNSLVSQNYIALSEENAISVAGYGLTINGNTITGNGFYPFFKESNGALGLSVVDSEVYSNIIANNQGFGIRIAGCSNTLIHDNTIENNSNGVELPNYSLVNGSLGAGNKVFRNNLLNNQPQVFISSNFASGTISSNQVSGTDMVSWDNGKVGNYWSDYQSKYPNATEVDASGVGNTPYVINQNNIDHHPLTQQVDISSSSAPASPSILPFAIIAVAIVVLVVIVTSLLLLYRRHRKTAASA
ncbi:MAG: right-handed parallel beta-helix repeat-containing protein [Candidatus Bathyarchaeia archaeon]